MAEGAKQACTFLHVDIAKNSILILVSTPPDLDEGFRVKNTTYHLVCAVTQRRPNLYWYNGCYCAWRVLIQVDWSFTHPGSRMYKSRQVRVPVYFILASL